MEATTKQKKEKKVKTPKVTATPEPAPTPIETETPTIIESKPKRKLSKWQAHVSAYAKENPKCGRELFKKAYATYKCSVSSEAKSQKA
jgi:hypothetical protein